MLRREALEIGGEAEVVEDTEATSNALGDLEEAVNSFDGGISQTGLHESDDAVKVVFDGGG